MLCGNYLKFEIKSNQSGGSPHCRLCSYEIDSLEHLIAQCFKFDDVRTRMKTSISSILKESKIQINISDLSDKQFTQFVLDPSSLNLPSRVNINHPVLPQLFQQSRDFCFAIDRIRAKFIT